MQYPIHLRLNRVKITCWPIAIQKMIDSVYCLNLSRKFWGGECVIPAEESGRLSLSRLSVRNVTQFEKRTVDLYYAINSCEKSPVHSLKKVLLSTGIYIYIVANLLLAKSRTVMILLNIFDRTSDFFLSLCVMLRYVRTKKRIRAGMIFGVRNFIPALIRNQTISYLWRQSFCNIRFFFKYI